VIVFSNIFTQVFYGYKDWKK